VSPFRSRLLLVAALGCAVPATSSCKRRPQPAAPAASASTASAAPPATTAPLPTASAVEPSAAAFADGGAPRGYELAKVWDVVATGDGAAVLLIDAKKTTVLPIFVGGTEALTIELRAVGEHYERPLTHDLLSSLVKELGGRPVKAQIDDLRDDTFFGSVFVRQGDRILQLDARPSDAIALALGSGTPLYVSQAVMLTSGVPRDQIDDEKAKNLATRKRGNPISL